MPGNATVRGRRRARTHAVLALALLGWAGAAHGAGRGGRPSRRPVETSAALVRARNAARLAGIQRVDGEPQWAWIVLHHTAAERDSLASISRYHAQRFGDALGIEYHFLIGNGHSAGDGEVQVARWQHRAPSIHVAHPERAPSAITITAQGNLHRRAPSSAQMLATEQLMRKLMALYHIPLHRISSNTRVDGLVTVCPGRYFPFDRLLWRLQQPAPPTPADWRDPLAPAPLQGPVASLDDVATALVWDVPCRRRIPISRWRELEVMRDGEVEARLLHIEGGRGCTPIQRRFLAIRNRGGWFWRELNGYWTPRLLRSRARGRPQAGAVTVRLDVRDERGVMQRCDVAVAAAPVCRLPGLGGR